MNVQFSVLPLQRVLETIPSIAICTTCFLPHCVTQYIFLVFTWEYLFRLSCSGVGERGCAVGPSSG